MKKLGNKILKILAINSEKYTVKLSFNDNYTGVVNLSHYFIDPQGLATEILKGNIFAKCFIEKGALAWPNGLELCPDMLKQLCLEQSRKKAA